MKLCKYCTEELLQGVICGQAFTEWKCVECGQLFTHENTATPKICKQCSEKLNKCEMCGREL